MKNKILILIMVLVLAAVFVFAGCTVRTTGMPGEAGVSKITVNATGSIKVMPDVAYVTVGVKTQAAQMKKAQGDNREKMNKLFEALKAAGLTEDDMRTTNYSAYPMYDYSEGDNKITGYEVTNMVQLTIKDIEAVGEFIDIAADAGANTAYPINFALLDETGFYNDALEDALEKARGKADTIAAAGEYKIIGTLEIAEGGAGYVPYMSDFAVMAEAAAYDGAPTPITAGELEVTASVTAVYEIQ